MLIPYQVDVPMARWPIANFALLGVTILVSALAIQEVLPDSVLIGMVQDGWSPTGLLGAPLLHAGYLHLIGNMIFLWVFGNAICAKLGNILYPAVYVGLALLAAVCHNSFDGSPMVGASGAINGVVGLFFIFYPLNDVTCFYLFGWRFGRFSVSGVWIILFWLAFDIWGAARGGDHVAYWAHLGGFGGGVLTATALLFFGLTRMDRGEVSLLDKLKIPYRRGEDESPEEEPAPRNRRALPRASAPGAKTSRPPVATPQENDAPLPLETSTIPSPAPVIPVAPTALVVHCACGKTLRVAARHAGRTGKCPGCGAALKIPVA